MASLLSTTKKTQPKPKTPEYFCLLKELDGLLVITKVLVLKDKSSH